VLAGDKETGITLMRMDSGLDTGPILATQRVPILPDMTTGELLVALAQAGRELIRRELLPLSCLIERARPQPTEGATYAPKISPKEGALQWTQTPLQLERRVRAFAPTPGAWFWCEGKRIKVFRASPLEGVPTQAPGTMLDAQCTIACAEGALRLLEIQPEGKGRMLGTEFLRGHPHLVGRKV
jgi:methionyl-tRNA formyltransferase